MDDSRRAGHLPEMSETAEGEIEMNSNNESPQVSNRGQMFVVVFDEYITSQIDYRALRGFSRSLPNCVSITIRSAWYLRIWNWVRCTHRMLMEETNKLLGGTDD